MSEPYICGFSSPLLNQAHCLKVLNVCGSAFDDKIKSLDGQENLHRGIAPSYTAFSVKQRSVATPIPVLEHCHACSPNFVTCHFFTFPKLRMPF
jgi:hypothetical protein